MELLVSFLLGIIFGSFLNVLIIRIPKGQSVVFGRSHCMSCNKELKFYHNVPLFSWLFLGGRCGYCKSKISIQYPLIELFSGLLFVLVTIKFPLSIPSFFIMMSFLMLLGLSSIDIKYQMVPDSLNLLAIFFAIMGAWSVNGVVTNLQNAFLFAGGFTLLRFTLSYYLTSSVYRAGLKSKTSWNSYYDRTPMIEAMGEGDIMVGATMGALLGIKLGFVAIFLSALIALVVMLFLGMVGKKNAKIAFVPFLTFATLIVFLFDSEILRYIEANY